MTMMSSATIPMKTTTTTTMIVVVLLLLAAIGDAAFNSVPAPALTPTPTTALSRRTTMTPYYATVSARRALLPATLVSTASSTGRESGFGTVPSLPFLGSSRSSTSLAMSTGEEGEKKKSDLPMLLDPGTKGGALFLTLVLLIIPFIAYNIATGVFGMDGIVAGRNIGVGFTVTTSLLWASTYVFRVATKDMTYAKQLKDYENAVIAKRLEELDEDEITAMMEDIEREEF